MINILEKSVGTIKGVGKKYLQTLNELEIYTIRDILYNIPYRVSSSTDFSSSVKDNEKDCQRWSCNHKNWRKI